MVRLFRCALMITMKPRLGLWRFLPRATGTRRCTKLYPSCSQQQCPRLIPARTYATVSAADIQFGQPVFETHPHLLRAGEVTPGITAQEYADRRAGLVARLPDNAIAILASSNMQYRSGSVSYEFHQNSDFLYLTGFKEPEAVAVIQKVGNSPDPIFHLYLRSKDEDAERWNGARSGQQAALDVFNADETGDIGDLQRYLRPLIAGASSIYTNIVKKTATFFNPPEALSSDFGGLLGGKSPKALRSLMNELRIIKSEAEIANMRMAGKISGRAFTNAMRRQWTKEKDLWAFLEYDFKTGGCEAAAYVPVVAGGKNGLSIHYVQNNDVLLDNEIVLVDAGGQYGGYIADISRAWPVGGKFSDPQRDLYEAVLKVQRTSVALCRESSNLTLDEIHTITEKGLRDQLGQLGFNLSGDALDFLFPHHVSHYVGLDIHDCPDYPRSVPLKAGQCVTVEPGIYVPNDDRWPQHFRGIAIRIEDSVCVQEDTALVLTTEAVKETVDIEALRE